MQADLAGLLQTLTPPNVSADVRTLAALLGREVGDVVHFTSVGECLSLWPGTVPPWMLPVARLRSGGAVLVDLRVAHEQGELHFVRQLGDRLLATWSLSTAEHARQAVVQLAHHAAPGTALHDQVAGWSALVTGVLGEPAFDATALAAAGSAEAYLAATHDRSPMTALAVFRTDPSEENLAHVEAAAGRTPGFAYVHLLLSGLVIKLGHHERFAPAVRDAFRAEAWGRYRAADRAYASLDLAGRLAPHVFDEGELARAKEGRTVEGLRGQLQLATEAGDDVRALHVASDLGFATTFDRDLLEGTLLPLFERRSWHWAVALCKLRLGR